MFAFDEQSAIQLDEIDQFQARPSFRGKSAPREFPRDEIWINRNCPTDFLEKG